MLLACSLFANSMDLKGTWKLHLDAEDKWISQDPSLWKFDDSIALPGTTDLAGKGPVVSGPVAYEYHLNRKYNFTGAAYYARTVNVPNEWEGKEAILFLERVMWQSRVWLDGKEVSRPQDSLCVPHSHNLGILTPGEHELIIRVDNRMIHPIGDKGHAYGAQTQSTWNGVVGKIELRPQASQQISKVRIFPSNNGEVRAEIEGKFHGNLDVYVTCTELPDDEQMPHVVLNLRKEQGEQTKLQIKGIKVNNPTLWSEFSPKLYYLNVTLTSADDNSIVDSHTASFGFREVSHDGTKLLINGSPVFMRGNLECAVFPKLGHPPTDVESWKKIWQVYKEHNLNHARFHSWCPPEAAFAAADEMGIYIQAETPIWIDHWMTKPNPRPEMDTLGHPNGPGKGDRSIDEFAQAELRRILDIYGNHPSFVFFCIGNELGVSNFEVTGTWIRDAKAYDPRRLYAASTARTITPYCDYNATHNIPGIGWVRQRVEFGTSWDYEERYSAAPVPIIAHEIGQWPVYVDWEKELPKYTGPLKPYRLEQMAKEAKKNGVYSRTARFHAASGAINRILYRYEVESFLRTPSCRGFQLLGMQDFTGQGEAHVGWLDPFYESKGTTSPEEFRKYCAPTVPLLKLPAFTFTTEEKPSVEVLVHHYGNEALESAALEWKLKINDENIDSGEFTGKDITAGSVQSIGSFVPDFSRVKEAATATLSIGIKGTGLSNDYQIWIYPPLKSSHTPDNVVICTDWLSEAKPALEQGMKVLLLANQMGGRQAGKLANWMPLYWSVPFFPGQNRDTLGLYVNAGHDAFKQFPTPQHGDWNWFRICKGAHGFDLTDITPSDYTPIVEPVTDFHLNRRLGSIFELQVGKGKLLVCGYDLSQNKVQDIPEAAQLRQSLVSYVAGESFQPQTALEPAVLDKLFTDPDLKLQKLPQRFANAEIYVNASGKLSAVKTTSDWNRNNDQILRLDEGLDYEVQCEGGWRDEKGSAWHGKNITINIKPRSGVPGKVYIHFADWNNAGRSGVVSLEGREQKLQPHPEGVWLEFPFIREDTNDSSLVIKAQALTGPNLMITDIALIPEED